MALSGRPSSEHQIAYAEFTPDWKGIHPQRVLKGARGDVQNDGYAGIKSAVRRPRRTAARRLQ
jgi:hypothetical protein